MAKGFNKAVPTIIFSAFFIALLALSPALAQGDWTVQFTEDFESGTDRRWELGPGWTVESDIGGNILRGVEHYFAIPKTNGWNNYSVRFQFRLIAGRFHTNFRETVMGEHNRYYVSAASDALRLHRQRGIVFDLLATAPVTINPEIWQTLEVSADSAGISVYLNDILEIEYEDTDQPLFFGRFSYETLDNAHVNIDNIVVVGEQPDEDTDPWIRTGGPSGGLGYDVRIHQQDKDVMFVTDNPSGINKSFDGGQTWVQKNTGVTTIAGDSNDGIPIFSLTIDPGEPNIVWAGTQEARGIYKSVDGGETWLKKDSGVVENSEISFRGFGIHPHESNIVFAGAEITTGIMGKEFDRALGKIYRTEDGGEVWDAVWDGQSLVRFVLFDYENPDILYASTGIFDREAMDTTGVGILKSTDGGFTWFEKNNGIPDSAGNQFVGFLEMHPENPQILYAASGNNAVGNGGVFKTTNGGDNWVELLSGDKFTIVTISKSNPDVVYAGSFVGFYRSDDGGDTWQLLQKPGGGYGPPGVTAGVPISAVVDPEDPYTVFANNYIGGNFVSTDSAVSWKNSSTGYTGAQLHDIAIDPDNPEVVCTIGRSGPFRSTSGGFDWIGIQYPPAVSPEWYAVAMHPTNNQEILISGEFNGNMYRSADGGASWSIVFDHPLVTGSCPTGPIECRHGFKAIEYARSNPLVVYAGMCKSRRTINGDFPPRTSYGMFKSVNGGISWDTINTGLPTSLLNINCIAVQQSNANIVYVGTWVDGVYKTTDGGQSWVAKNVGLTTSDIRSLAIHPVDTNTIYAGTGAGGGIFISSDGGNTWTSLNTGVNLQCPQYLLPVGKVNQGMSLKSPPRFSSGPDYYNAGWTSIRALAIDPTNPDNMYAGDYNSGVYATSNGGTSWTPMNDSLTMRTVNALAISSDGGVLYAATFGGGVFRLPIGTNHAPKIAATYPPVGAIIPMNQIDTLELCVSAYDLDGDHLSYIWTLDGLDWPADYECCVANGAELDPGYHVFEARIRDADTAVTVTWELDILVDVSDSEEPSNLPKEFALSQNHPNPFNPTTRISYALPIRSQVNLKVFNILGQWVTTLVDREEAAGYYEINWDGTTHAGEEVASGIYFYRLETGGRVMARKMLLLK